MAKRTINIDTKDIEFIIEVINESPMKDYPKAKDILRKMKNNMKTIKISSAKNKGRSLQKKICSDIAEMIGMEFNQSDDSCCIHSREMGQAGKDIVLRGDAQKLFPYCIEAKASESLNLLDAIQQAQSNTEDPYDWMVVHKRKTLSEPIVIISWSAFKKLFIKKS